MSSLIHADSLAATLDAVQDALFSGRGISLSERTAVTEWLAERGRTSGGYMSGMAAPTAKDMAGVTLFTGDRLTSRASIKHILGEEACMVVARLGVHSECGDELIQMTRGRMLPLVIRKENEGWFCCGKCSVALWRNVLAGGLADRDHLLELGFRHLRSARNEDGWHRYPFFPTLLFLIEQDGWYASSERRFIAPVVERRIKKSRPSEPYGRRRIDIMERLLARV